jgi:ATP-dependent Clp protease ATP-binding subunit ClpB
MNEVRDHFPPEFLNRLDETILFRSLDRADLERILKIQLLPLRRKLAERHLELKVDDEVRELLTLHGYDPVYGARPLKRVIKRELVDPIARGILEGRFEEGASIHARAREGEIELQAE